MTLDVCFCKPESENKGERKGNASTYIVSLLSLLEICPWQTHFLLTNSGHFFYTSMLHKKGYNILRDSYLLMIHLFWVYFLPSLKIKHSEVPQQHFHRSGLLKLRIFEPRTDKQDNRERGSRECILCLKCFSCFFVPTVGESEVRGVQLVPICDPTTRCY